ncbi:type VII secretion integral membrane protein EccD [Crossiella sp. CA-258035]|uniref:type VII secretion integral membrane protein EccD n=1 Tax=Crossiella sp. CA-258035 TaxID=2981138 RepID=UPI0024BC2A2B|nr:type VII secretion integral membrane protein EccD [Crossiella sp. CA-258035]WHT18021.1 type VII secretion integral membrane protein EccD [Crossiella sp. CA-258035]
MTTTGLVRVTVAAPHRRIDMALPEQSSVAEIVPGLLRHAGEHLADDGAADGGWLLRRGDGSALELGRTLGSYRIRDGEVLHLTSRRTEWPELEYDDLVDAIADGAGRAGRAWSARHTRLAGLAVGGLVLLLGLAVVLRAGPPWPMPGLWSLLVSLLLLAVGATLARTAGDAVAGAVFGALSLPYSFLGGALLLAGSHPLLDLGAPQIQAGSAALLFGAVLGHLGTAHGLPVFAAAATTGLLGVLGGVLAGLDTFDGAQAAAIVAGAVLAFSPLLAPLAIRLARVPMPVLPRTTADLVRNDPQPPRPAVYQAVARAHGLLTGMLVGVALVAVVCQVLLVRSGRTSALWLLVVLALGFLLRARLYPVLWQRVPLLGAGVCGVVCLALGPLLSGRVAIAGAVLLVVGGLVVLAGLHHSRRQASPYLGRYAELFEVAVVLAVVPVVCAVLDLYAYLRGLGG